MASIVRGNILRAHRNPCLGLLASLTHPTPSMRKPQSLLVSFFLLLPLLAHGQMIDHIDWPGFMARNDMVWNRVPQDWNHAAFQGNGELGANIYAEPDGSLAWHIGRTDVVYDQARIPIGNLVLRPVGKI